MAIHIKPANQLKDRTLEKIRIEQAYWLLKGIKFMIITDRCLPKNIINNLEFVIGHARINLTDSHSEKIKHMIIQSINIKDGKINELCREIDDKMQLNKGESLNMFYQMIAIREIDVDLRNFSIGPITHSTQLRKHTFSTLEF
ncbi:TnsA endonuclease C-terminal domain-containing protein [Endozoicomonas sp. SCSIO W0465]|uniref:TnsA endonuclease C-terminal domain-containing protein n=1 Tax=Endozoicomonas sp. SCSIO W0465 TaxID=2918516 RepID=UPI0035318E2B